MPIVSFWTVAVVMLGELLLIPAFAAQQLVTTKTLLVKNPPSGARKVLWKVKETAATVMGNPITEGGATLRIQLTAGGDQCVTMPASGWSAIGTIGFKYKDATLTNGPVKVAQVKKTPSGTFLVKALLKNGGPASIAVTPGNPTASYATNFTLGTGDEYCGGTATATPNPNDASTFKVSNDGTPTACVASCSPTSTITSTTATTSNTGGSVTTTSTTSTTLGGPFGCEGAPLPTTAPPMIIIAGQVVEQGLDGTTTPLASASVEALPVGGGAALASDISDAGGLFSLAVTTGGVPVDAYLRVMKTGYVQTNDVPASPYAADASPIVHTYTNAALDLLQTLAGTSQTPGNGLVRATVIDCEGTPITAATASSTPAAGAVRYNSASGIPSGAASSTAADGVAYLFNVAPGSATVDALKAPVTFREHAIPVSADILTSTAITP